MTKLTLENVESWKYTDEIGLDEMENLHKKHDEYEALQNSCQEGLVFAAIKLGEIYIDAKVELGTQDKFATNQELGNYFGKTEATIRNYIKIAENRDKLFETAVPEILSVRNMLKIINGTATQNPDGTIVKGDTIKNDSTKKVTEKTLKRYETKIANLETENLELKNEKKELSKEITVLKNQIKKLEKLQTRTTSLLGEDK